MSDFSNLEPAIEAMQYNSMTLNRVYKNQKEILFPKEKGSIVVTLLPKFDYVGDILDKKSGLQFYRCGYRTFIAPTQEERENMVYVKLNAITSDLKDKRVVVIDDSIVRGTTSRRLVQILKRAGAKEVHFRVSSPPVKFPCYLGIDTPSKSELISSNHEVEEICEEIGADSLALISLKGMLDALNSSRQESPEGKTGFCQGCFSGVYPVAGSK